MEEVQLVGAGDKNTPFFKMVLDDFMLLMFLGVAVYIIFYVIWGVMELASIPQIPESIKQEVLKK